MCKATPAAGHERHLRMWFCMPMGVILGLGFLYVYTNSVSLNLCADCVAISDVKSLRRKGLPASCSSCSLSHL